MRYHLTRWFIDIYIFKSLLKKNGAINGPVAPTKTVLSPLILLTFKSLAEFTSTKYIINKIIRDEIANPKIEPNKNCIISLGFKWYRNTKVLVELLNNWIIPWNAITMYPSGISIGHYP